MCAHYATFVIKNSIIYIFQTLCVMYVIVYFNSSCAKCVQIHSNRTRRGLANHHLKQIWSVVRIHNIRERSTKSIWCFYRKCEIQFREKMLFYGYWAIRSYWIVQISINFAFSKLSNGGCLSKSVVVFPSAQINRSIAFLDFIISYYLWEFQAFSVFVDGNSVLLSQNTPLNRALMD